MGYDATTIRRIAAELDCAVGSIYRFFSGKRQLLYAVTQRDLEVVADQAQSGVAIEQCERHYREQVARAPQSYRLMFWLACADSAAEPLIPHVIDRIVDGWTRSTGDPESARARWSALHGSLMFDRPVRVADHKSTVIAQLRPLPPQSTPDHAEPAASAMDEDVCLL